MELQTLQRKIGSELKKLRLINEWTQEEVAEKLRICRRAYGDIERGETDIHLSRLLQVADLYGVEVNALMPESQHTTYHTQHNNQGQNYCQYNIASTSGIQSELEKTQAALDFRSKENDLLREKIADLQKIIALLESSQSISDSAA